MAHKKTYAKMQTNQVEQAAHVGLESLHPGEGFLRRELALAMRSEKNNRGRRMDYVLGILEESEDDVEEVSGQSEGTKSIKDIVESVSVKLHKIETHKQKSKNVGKALSEAEEKAKLVAAKIKLKIYEESEKQVLHKLQPKSPKKYIADMQDIQLPTTSKENLIPSFKTSRGTVLSKKLSSTENGKEKAQAKTAKQNSKGGNLKFMTKYGLQRYANLFKQI